MSTNNSSNSKPSRYPNMGNLTVALLEHVVEPVLGKDFIKELKLPYTNNQLRNKFRDALFAAEKEFIQKSHGSRISGGLIQLHIADLDSIQKAFWDFVENPAGPEFPRTLYKQFCVDYPKASDSERSSAVDLYLKAIRIEILNINEDVRQKVSAAVLLSLLDHVESIDKKLDTLKSLENLLTTMVNLLSKSEDPYSRPAPGNFQPREKIKSPRDSRELKHVSFQRIDFDISKILGDLTPAEVENLHGIIENWMPPLIEQYIDLDDYDRPYGEICGNVIETLLFSVRTKINSFSTYGILSDTSNSTIKSESEHERFVIVNKIFRSYFLESLPSYKSKNSVYLKCLSDLFPSAIPKEQPFGFYLMDMKSPGTESQLWNLIYDRLFNRLHWVLNDDRERFQLIYISDNKLSAWSEFSRIENKSVPNDWKHKLKLVTKTVISRKPKYYLHLVFFEKKAVKFLPLDIDQIGYQTNYQLNISLQELAQFLAGFAEDFLSLASKMIVSERQAREYTQSVANQLRNKK